MSPLELRPHTAHLWLCVPENITDPVLIGRYHQLMTEEEKVKQRRFHFDRHRHQYLVTRALVRTTLSRYAPVTPEAWRFEPNQYGRPYLAPQHRIDDLYFNLSHTDGLVACAVARGGEIGIDVENIGRGGDLVQIADRFFSKAEVTDLHTVPKERQEDRFFDYWTLKESYIKARGMGLSIPLGDFGFSLSDAHADIRLTLAETQDDRADRWQFRQWRFGSDHKIALCLETTKTNFETIKSFCVPLAHQESWDARAFRKGPATDNTEVS